MQNNANKDQNKGNKVSNDLAGSHVPKNMNLSFEQRLHTDLFLPQGKGKAAIHIDLVKAGLCFMSLEEAIEAIPKATKKLLIDGKLVEVVNKTQENWEMFKMAWYTFHAPNTGIPEMFIQQFKPYTSGQQELAKLENSVSRVYIDNYWYQTIHLKDGSTKQIKHLK